MNDELDKYLWEIASQLNVDPDEEREILQEIRAHLEEALSEWREKGLREEESLAQVVENFGEAREVGRMLGRLHNNPDWVKVGLAILPGLLALGRIGLPSSLFAASIARTLAQGSLISVCVLLIIVGFIRERRFAVWSFPALGILLFPAGGILLVVEWWMDLPFAQEASRIWAAGPFVLMVVGLAAIGAFAVYHVCRQHRTHIPRLAWVLLGLLIMFSVAEVFTLSVGDRSPDKWKVVWAVLPSIVLTMGMILSPVAIGLLLARRAGLLAGLIVVAAEFGLVDMILDPGYALGLRASNQTIVTLVSVIPAMFFLVVSPIWVLRSRSTRGRVAGLLLPAFVAVVSVEMISGSVRPYYLENWYWLVRALGSAQLWAAVALAAVMYQWIGRQRRVGGIRHQRGTVSDEAARVTGGKVLSTGHQRI